MVASCWRTRGVDEVASDRNTRRVPANSAEVEVPALRRSGRGSEKRDQPGRADM